MKQEDVQLLLQDLSTRLLCGVNCISSGIWKDRIFKMTGVSLYSKELPTIEFKSKNNGVINIPANLIKPYLRPMSSMTDEERKEYKHLVNLYASSNPESAISMVNWLNSHYFDYRGLIEKGLALEATMDMYECLKQK